MAANAGVDSGKEELYPLLLGMQVTLAPVAKGLPYDSAPPSWCHQRALSNQATEALDSRGYCNSVHNNQGSEPAQVPINA